MIARLAEAAAAAVRIFCLPLDGEATRIAEDAEARLFGLGLAVKTVADTSKHAAIAQALGSNDLVLYFATQSTGQPMPPGAEAAQARGITVGALAPQAHPLRSVADAFLGLTPSDGGLESVFPSDRKYADQLALDCLEMAVRGRLPRKR
jgi:DNA-binding MurR/RpiR family transcriptional regulator